MKKLLPLILFFLAFRLWAADVAEPPAENNEISTPPAATETVPAVDAAGNVGKALKNIEKLTADLKDPVQKFYAQCSLLLAQAKKWQESGNPEWMTLADNVLERLRMPPPDSDSVENFLIQAETLSLKGDYESAVKIIFLCMKQYFPKALSLRSTTVQPPQATALLETLGQCNLKKAEANFAAKDKIKYYTLAAGAFLSAVNGTDKKSDDFNRRRELLINCQKSLELLGQQLQLPEHLQSAEGSDTELYIRQMFREHKYSATLALIKKYESEKLQLPCDLWCIKTECLFQVQEYDKCIDETLKLGQVYDTQAAQEVMLNLAGEFTQIKQEKQTEKLLLFYIKKFPESGELAKALLVLGNYYRSVNQPAKAAEYFESAGRKQNNPQSILNAAQCYYEVGNFIKAKGCAEQAEPTLPANSVARLQAKLISGLAGYKSAKERQLLLTSGEKLSEIAKIDSVDVAMRCQAALFAGLAFEQATEYVRAAGLFERFCQISTNDELVFVAYKHWLNVCLNDKKYQAAYEIAKKLSDKFPQRRDTVKMVLLGFKYMGERQIWQSAINTALLLNNSPNVLPEELVYVIESLEKIKEPQYAKPCMQAALQLSDHWLPTMFKSPFYGHLLFQTAVIAESNGDKTKALDCLNKLLALNRIYRYNEAKFLRGNLLIQSGKYEDGKKDYQELIWNGDDLALTLKASFRLGELCRKENNLKEALSYASYSLAVANKKDLSSEQQEWIKKSLLMVKDLAEKLDKPKIKQQAVLLLSKNFNL